MIEQFAGRYAFLSNFDESPFCAPWYWNDVIRVEGLAVENLRWLTNEHYFQAAKARERSQALTIQSLSGPGQAKRRGRQIRAVDGWNSIRLNAMLLGLRYKFSNPVLRRMLIDTWPHRLIEGNNHGDQFWGAVWTNVFPSTEAQIAWAGPRVDYGLLVGQNWLGRLLELVREEARHA